MLVISNKVKYIAQGVCTYLSSSFYLEAFKIPFQPRYFKHLSTI